MAQQTPAQRDMMRHLQPQAIAAWWDSGHVGWTIFPMDSEQFLEVRGCVIMHLPECMHAVQCILLAYHAVHVEHTPLQSFRCECS